MIYVDGVKITPKLLEAAGMREDPVAVAKLLKDMHISKHPPIHCWYTATHHIYPLHKVYIKI